MTDTARLTFRSDGQGHDLSDFLSLYVNGVHADLALSPDHGAASWSQVVPAGDYVVAAGASGRRPVIRRLTLAPGIDQIVQIDWAELVAQPYGGTDWRTPAQIAIDRARDPASAPRYGTLTVATEPAAATVILDGQPMPPNHTRSDVMPGEHELDVTAVGFVAQRRTVVTAPDGSQTVRVVLERVPAGLGSVFGQGDAARGARRATIALYALGAVLSVAAVAVVVTTVRRDRPALRSNPAVDQDIAVLRELSAKPSGRPWPHEREFDSHYLWGIEAALKLARFSRGPVEQSPDMAEWQQFLRADDGKSQLRFGLSQSDPRYRPFALKYAVNRAYYSLPPGSVRSRSDAARAIQRIAARYDVKIDRHAQYS